MCELLCELLPLDRLLQCSSLFQGVNLLPLWALSRGGSKPLKCQVPSHMAKRHIFDYIISVAQQWLWCCRLLTSLFLVAHLVAQHLVHRGLSMRSLSLSESGQHAHSQHPVSSSNARGDVCKGEPLPLFFHIVFGWLDDV
jgi:hypothetical protein